MRRVRLIKYARLHPVVFAQEFAYTSYRASEIHYLACLLARRTNRNPADSLFVNLFSRPDSVVPVFNGYKRPVSAIYRLFLDIESCRLSILNRACFDGLNLTATAAIQG